jgi:hypothetical protein
MSVDFEPPVYKCDRCMRTFDKVKIVQCIYGTRHCNKCMNELRNHEIRDRVSNWTRPTEIEDVSIPICDLISNV